MVDSSPPVCSAFPFPKGYALIEYEKFEEAEAAILGINGAEHFGQTIFGNWAFSTRPFEANLSMADMDTAAGSSTRVAKGIDKGTTILAFKFRGGIILAADSRMTNNGLFKNDNTDKVFPLSKMAAAVFGDYNLAKGVVYDVGTELKQLAKSPTVEEAALKVGNAFEDLVDRKVEVFHKTGVMIAGWDRSQGFQIQTIVSWDSIIHILDDSPIVMGSGSNWVEEMIDRDYNEDMDVTAAVNFALKALFVATFFDGGSGGILHVYHVHEHGYNEIQKLNAFQAYQKFYFDDTRWTHKVLFVLRPLNYVHIVTPEHFQQFFSKHGKVSQGHEVAQTEKFTFYRICFDSDQGALAAYNYIKEKVLISNPKPDLKTFRDVLHKMHIIGLEDFYGEKCSLVLLDVISDMWC